MGAPAGNARKPPSGQTGHTGGERASVDPPRRLTRSSSRSLSKLKLKSTMSIIKMRPDREWEAQDVSERVSVEVSERIRFAGRRARDGRFRGRQ